MNYDLPQRPHRQARKYRLKSSTHTLPGKGKNITVSYHKHSPINHVENTSTEIHVPGSLCVLMITTSNGEKTSLKNTLNSQNAKQHIVDLDK